MGWDLGHFLHDAGTVIGKMADGVATAFVDASEWPFTIAKGVLEGQQLDHAVMNGLRQALSSFKVLGPYAEAICSFIPGIGTVIAACIGGALAIANGKPIDEILASAVAGAIPGGVIYVAAYHIGKEAINKTPILLAIEQGIMDAAGALGVVVPEGTKDLIITGLQIAKMEVNAQVLPKAHVDAVVAKVQDPKVQAAILAAAKPGSRKNVADIVIDHAVSQFQNSTPDQQKKFKDALKIGMAMSHAKNLQDAAKKDVLHPAATHKLSQNAAILATSDPVIAAARANLKGQGVHGFDQGIALMHRPGTMQVQLAAVRSNLGQSADMGRDQRARHSKKVTHRSHHTADQTGFDTALALHIGRKRAMQPSYFSHQERAAHALVHGLKYAPDNIRTAVLKDLPVNQATREGVKKALAETSHLSAFLWTTGAGLIGAFVAGPFGGIISAGLTFMLIREES